MVLSLEEGDGRETGGVMGTPSPRETTGIHWLFRTECIVTAEQSIPRNEECVRSCADLVVEVGSSVVTVLAKDYMVSMIIAGGIVMATAALLG